MDHELIVNYIEQMKYLALTDTSATEKVEAMIEIEKRMEEVRLLLEEYRRNYGYGNCNESP